MSTRTVVERGPQAAVLDRAHPDRIGPPGSGVVRALLLVAPFWALLVLLVLGVRG